MGPISKYFKPPSLRNIVPTALRVIFGAIFLYSGVVKFVGIAHFEAALVSLNVIPGGIVPYWAIVIPALEIFLGAAIVLDLKTAFLCKVNVFMLAAFTAVIWVEVASGVEASCGCFGNVSSEKIGPPTILRNVVLLLWGIALSSYHEARDVSGHKTPATGHIIPIPFWKRSFLTLFYRTVSFVVFASLLTLCLVLSMQNKTLQERLWILTDAALSLKPGELVTPFEGTDINGMQVSVSYKESSRTLLFVMKASCSDCRTTIPLWNAIASRLRGDSVTIIGVSVDSLRDSRNYADQHGIAFQLLSVPHPSFTANYRIVATPQTILISSQRVEKVWRGALAEVDRSQILNIVQACPSPALVGNPKEASQ